MITSFIPALLLQAQPEWAPSHLRQDQFEFRASSKIRPLAVWLRKSDGVGVRLEWSSRKPEDLNSPLPSPNIKRNAQPHSGYPLAFDAVVTPSTNYLRLYARTQHEDVTATLTGPASSELGSRKPQDWNFSSDEVWFEGAVREVLARIAARRLGTQLTKSINGVSILCVATKDNKTTFVDLTDFAEKLNVEVSENIVARRYSFQYQGKLYVVPLAAREVKVGPTWCAVSDVVMLHEEHVFVPISVFTNQQPS